MPAGIQLGAGVRTSAVYRISSQGDLKQTSNPYDIAIQGPGFFRVQMPDGTDAYTRAGIFRSVAQRPDRDRQGLYRRARHRGAGQCDCR